LRTRVLHLPCNGGIGVAMQSGYLFAAKDGGYRYVLQLDGDGQHDGADIPALVERCDKDHLDLCIGSRFLDPGGGGFQSTFARRTGSRFLRGLFRLLCGVRVTDPTSGLRCAGPRACRRFAAHYPEDYPEPESLFWCVRSGFKVGEVPVRMRQRQGGVSSIAALESGYYLLKVSLALLLDRVRGKEV
jgi:glycosyltransferase involved in cell wall biosynthesis